MRKSRSAHQECLKFICKKLLVPTALFKIAFFIYQLIGLPVRQTKLGFHAKTFSKKANNLNNENDDQDK